MEQVNKHLHKLIDVIKVSDISDDNAVARELALIRVRVNVRTRSEVMQIADLFRANIIDVALDSVIIEVVGDEEKVNAMQNLLVPFGVAEVMRTGIVAMTRGMNTEGNSSKPQRQSHTPCLHRIGQRIAYIDAQPTGLPKPTTII